MKVTKVSTVILSVVSAFFSLGASIAVADGYQCSVSDMTLNLKEANFCYYDSSISNDKPPETFAGNLNDYRPVAGGEYAYVLKPEAVGVAATGLFSGITFELLYTQSQVEDTGYHPFLLTWHGENTALPAYVDLAFALKAGNDNPNSGGGVAFYYFDDLYLAAEDGSYGGTYTVIFQNQKGEALDLSHMTMYARGASDPVPEPATMLLFGTGLAGVAGIVRRKRS